MLSRQYLKIAISSRSFLRCNTVYKRYTKNICLFNSNKKLTSQNYSCNPHLRRAELSQQPQPIRNIKENRPGVNNAVSSAEVVEKYIAALNTDIYQKNRVYKNDFLRVLAKVKESNFSTIKQGLLLIRCCSELMPDETAASRMALVEQVWEAITPHTNLTVDHYNELLKVYIANNRTLSARSFIERMAPVTPNMTTYELVLRAFGEAGDLNQATEVISNMKSLGFPANENIFCSLIICQGKAGQLQNIQDVLTMMKSLKIEQSADTYTAIARALAWNKKPDIMLDKMKEAINRGLLFNEVQIMDIVKTLAVVGSYTPMQKVLKFLPDEVLEMPSISPYMQSVTTLLVFQNHPVAALEIYKCLPLPSFGPKDDRGLHGRSLVRDCVKAAVPSSIIGLITQDLMSSGRNPVALQNAAEAALQMAKVPLALDMLARMKQMGIPIRPHYFWPILLYNSKSYGEKGIMNTITTMVHMDVKPDYETVKDYVIPYVSFTSPQNLMKKFQETGLSTATVLTPMMETLLNTSQVRAASELSELFHSKIDAEKLLKPLVKGYLTSADITCTVHTLEEISSKAIDKNKDWVGRFLCKLMQHKKIKEDMSDVLNLLQALNNSSLRISTIAADFCFSRLPEKHEKTDAFQSSILTLVDEKTTDSGDVFDQQMPHPKQMNEESLRAHLIELEAKGMNTRGVLRKLLQQYCRDGNLAAAREIIAKCQKEGVFLSAGMKASIFDLHVKLGELDLAELSLADLNKSAPNFVLDEFKIIDFATLMVYRDKIPKAMDLITNQSKRRNIQGGRAIAMNCWRLLDATAAHGSHIDVRNMLDHLTKYKYCKPTNVMLGPLIRVHLKNDNIVEAVNEFVHLSTKYHTTPLKHELLCKILQTMSGGQSEDNFLNIEKSNGRHNKLVHTVLDIDKKVHGASDVQLTLISALADVNYKKTVRKLFMDPSVKFHPEALKRRCERFAAEKKVQALEVIAESARDLRHVDVDEIYDMILDVHQRNDNYTEAINLWTRMQEADVKPSQKFIHNLCALIKSGHREVPPELAIMLDRQAEAS